MVESEYNNADLESDFLDIIFTVKEKLEEVGVPEQAIHEVEHTENGFSQQSEIRPDLETGLKQIKFQHIEKTSQFVDKVEELYGYRISGYSLQRLVTDIFGEQGQYLTKSGERAERVFQQLISELEKGSVEHLRKGFLTGVDLNGGPIKITDRLTIRNPTNDDISYRIKGIGSVLPGGNLEIPPTGISHSVVVEHETTEPPYFGGQRDIIRELVIPSLRLVNPGNPSLIHGETTPKSYLGISNYTVPNSRQEPLPRSNISQEDEHRIQKIFNVLRNEFNNEGGDFSYPLSAAIDHYETSIEKRVYARESVTFSVIGLEALYGGRKGIVTAYCPLFLSQIAQDLDPNEVRKDLKAGYNEYRNQWAHGGRRKSSGKDTQQSIWEYLRLSIVGFCLMSEGEQLNKGTRNQITSLLEKATIDDMARKKLKQKTANIDLRKYVQSPST